MRYSNAQVNVNGSGAGVCHRQRFGAGISRGAIAVGEGAGQQRMCCFLLF